MVLDHSAPQTLQIISVYWTLWSDSDNSCPLSIVVPTLLCNINPQICQNSFVAVWSLWGWDAIQPSELWLPDKGRNETQQCWRLAVLTVISGHKYQFSADLPDKWARLDPLLQSMMHRAIRKEKIISIFLLMFNCLHVFRGLSAVEHEAI